MRQKIIELLLNYYQKGSSDNYIRYSDIYKKLIEMKKRFICDDFVHEIMQEKEKDKKEYLKNLQKIEEKYCDEIEKILKEYDEKLLANILK